MKGNNLFNIKDRFRNIKYGVQNLVIWLPVIWKDRWWDSYYIYPILHKKLSLIEKATREHGVHVDAEKDADKIRKCVLLLERIMADEYMEESLKYHDEKWGETIMDFKGGGVLFKHENVKTKKDEIEERKSFKSAMVHEENMRKQDIDLLFKMMSKHIQTWWD